MAARYPVRVVDRVIVCDRRGRSAQGHKSDQHDADELSDLLRCGTLRAVYHGSPARATLKELTRTYQHLVEYSTRVMLRLKTLFRARGIRTPGRAVYDAEQRPLASRMSLTRAAPLANCVVGAAATTRTQPDHRRVHRTALTKAATGRLPAAPLPRDLDDLADTIGRMAPIRLHGELRRIRLAAVDGIDDRVVLRHRRADVAREHADVHPNVPLGLRLHAVVHRDQPRAGTRLHDPAVETLVSLVQTSVVHRGRTSRALEFGVQSLSFLGDVPAFRMRTGHRP